MSEIKKEIKWVMFTDKTNEGWFITNEGWLIEDEHTIADIARWVIDQGFNKDLVYHITRELIEKEENND